MTASKYKINKNIWLGTFDKHHPKTIYLEGGFWLGTSESSNVELLEQRVKKEVKKLLPRNITIIEYPKVLTDINRFSFQIHFINHTKTKFNQYCERIAPLISHRMPLFLDIISDCGFSIHNTKKGA